MKLSQICPLTHPRHRWYSEGDWVKVKVSQQWPQTSGKLKVSNALEPYTTTFYSPATTWLGFQGHEFKGQGYRNVFQWRIPTDSSRSTSFSSTMERLL